MTLPLFDDDGDDFGGPELDATYDVIMMDPPWPERGGGKIKRGADKHYDVHSRWDILEIILRAPVWRISKDAHLYMCTTMASLADSVWLMEALGFKYTTHAVWVKADDPNDSDRRDQLEAAAEITGDETLGVTDMSLGQYFRGEHELVLFGTRGRGYSVKTEDKSIRSVIYARVPRGEDGKRVHSRKPDKLYKVIERRSKGRMLEMFSRVPRPGWDVWGNEV